MDDGPASFPETHWSAICQRGFSDSVAREHLDEFMRLYWKPIFWQIRCFHLYNNEDARDYTQEFLLHVFERDLLEKYDRARGRLRTYIKGSLDAFMRQQRERQRTQKRGGFAEIRQFDPQELAIRPNESPDAAFDRQWKLALLTQGVRELEARLRQAKRETRWEVFRRIEMARESYENVATALGLTRDQLRWELSEAKGELQKLVRNLLRETVSTQADFEDELDKMGW